MARFLCIALILPSICAGVILRVPVDYQTIQEALDAVQTDDTVLVDVATYAETLTAPPLSFVLKGNVTPDTGEYPRPIINPSSIPGSDTLACLILPESCRVEIEDFKFVNGPEMFPRPYDDWYFGGIINFSTLPVTLKKCRFDSVYWGIAFGDYFSPNQIILEECQFLDMTSTCAYSRGSLVASDCLVSGCSKAGFAGLYDVLIERCRFTGETDGWAGIYRGNNIIRDCIFGPGICLGEPVAIYSHWGGDLFENNLLAGIGLTSTLMEITCGDTGFVTIRANEFTENYIYQYQSAKIRVADDWFTIRDSLRVIFEENLFHNTRGCLPDHALTTGIWLYTVQSRSIIRRNHFVSVRPLAGPVIGVDTLGSLHRIVDNIIYDNGLALKEWYDDQTVDASYNFWGHFTGPYHEFLNPTGLGDQVGDFILFSPWYPDSNFFVSLDERDAALPLHFSLDAFPNPFNSVVTLRLQVPEPSILRVDLYNTLGRKVEEIWSGPVGQRKEIVYDAAALPSGIYFARAWQTIYNRSVALQKLVLIK